MKFRFQFRLRTLLAAVTVFCVLIGGYVGCQKRIVNERRALLKAYEGTPFPPYIPGDDSKLPAIRRWLGDHCYALVCTPDRNEETFEQFRRVFPEAVLQRPDRGRPHDW